MSQIPTQKNEILERYYQELKSLYETKATKELSFRTPLENLLKALKPSPSYTIIQEAKSEGKSGAKPDFDVYQKIDKQDELSYNRLIGFVECKDIDKDLDFESEQIKRYLEISPNIILTNYRRFMLLSFGKVIYEASLFDESLNTHLFTQENKEEFFALISAFFADTNTQIKSKAELVKVLSSQSFYLSIALKNAKDDKSDKEQNALFNEFWQKTYDTFKSIQKIDFSELDFCDTIAQSIVYGLFVSFIENDKLEIEKIDTHSFIELLPNHFKTLHEFIYFSLPAFALPKRVLYVLNNVKKTLALLDKASMAKFLDLEIEKIAIYLYEDFLKEYDELRSTQKRKQGGVFYTPEPVVNMIVSCLDELLQRKFDKPKGFLDSEVKVLDFATGTGSFLATVFEKIISKERQAFRNDTIKHKFLKDIYGFEISFVAYIVARLKLGQILKNAGFSDFNDADFPIYLNNTLDLSENANFTMSMPLLNLDNEWKKARDIKHNKNLLVILGNPPYNMRSKNKGAEILNFLQDYKPKNERNIQPLDDDYIKFIRFAQWKLTEQSKNHGVMGFITNNSYLDGAIHYKMRESLAKTFDEIYILNLHGDSGNENVFTIQVGVCISIFVKYNDSRKSIAKVHYFSTNDNEILRKADKFAILNDIAQNGLESIKWQVLNLDSPYFWFVPKKLNGTEYENFWSLTKNNKAIFQNHSSAITTGQDNICVQTNKHAIESTLQDCINLDDKQIQSKYNIKNKDDWNIEWAKDCVKNNNGQIMQIAHRPFDSQWTYYHKTSNGFLSRPRYEIAKHFIEKENFGLMFQRGLNQGSIFVVDKMGEGNFLSGRTYIAPLYCYDLNLNKINKTPNFTREFSEFKANHKVLKDKTPKQILAFIYGNLYNPAYRAKYIEYLKIGFPRIDFEVSQSHFEKIATLGQNLIDLHLMKSIPSDKDIDFVGQFNASLPIDDTNPNKRYELNTIKLNKSLSIKGINKQMWEYKIGGYEVLKQWLKYRKNYQPSKEELEHFLRICNAIKATISIQNELAKIN